MKNRSNADESDVNKIKWTTFLAFESYGVKIGVRSNDAPLIEQCRTALGGIFPGGWREIAYEERAHLFSVYLPADKKRPAAVYKNEELVGNYTAEHFKIDALESQLRLTVAEFAPEVVFLHAGAVGFRGKAIIIPGVSFSGKTTLVAELSKRGLEYYSDEYAVIDRRGWLHPFPKKLSLRGIIDDYTQIDVPVEELGGKKGVAPLAVGMILVTRYRKGARFKPERISAGKGIIESLANSVSIRQNPELVLQTLSFVAAQAAVIKTNRSEVKKFADQFLRYLDEIEF